MSTRAVSPFIVFCNSRRDEVKAANPNAAVGDIARLLAELWKNTQRSEKEAYEKPRKAPEPVPAQNEPELRRSSRLRNKNLGLNFWGNKINK
jgi:hypothetical protein